MLISYGFDDLENFCKKRFFVESVDAGIERYDTFLKIGSAYFRKQIQVLGG